MNSAPDLRRVAVRANGWTVEMVLVYPVEALAVLPVIIQALMNRRTAEAAT